MSNIIKVGRREVDCEKFIEAVKTSRYYKDICGKLGFNDTVSTTRAAIKEAAKGINLDISHLTEYTRTEKVINSVSNRIKTFNIASVNQAYYNSIEEKFGDRFVTYKPSIGAFLEFIGNRDFITVDVTEIENYVKAKEGSDATRQNCMAHLRSLMINTVKNNVSNAVDKVSKNMLIWLISEKK